MYEQNNHSPFWQPQDVVCREFADTVGENYRQRRMGQGSLPRRVMVVTLNLCAICIRFAAKQRG